MLLVGLPCWLFAQQKGGSISGLVSSEDAGDPVAHAAITLSLNGAVVLQTQTDSKGSYSIQYLETGQYQMVVSSFGYATVVISDIHILAYQHFDINPMFEYGSYDRSDTLQISYRELIPQEETHFGVANQKKGKN